MYNLVFSYSFYFDLQNYFIYFQSITLIEERQSHLKTFRRGKLSIKSFYG